MLTAGRWSQLSIGVGPACRMVAPRPRKRAAKTASFTRISCVRSKRAARVRPSGPRTRTGSVLQLNCGSCSARSAACRSPTRSPRRLSRSRFTRDAVARRRPPSDIVCAHVLAAVRWVHRVRAAGGVDGVGPRFRPSLERRPRPPLSAGRSARSGLRPRARRARCSRRRRPSVSRYRAASLPPGRAVGVDAPALLVTASKREGSVDGTCFVGWTCVRARPGSWKRSVCGVGGCASCSPAAPPGTRVPPVRALRASGQGPPSTPAPESIPPRLWTGFWSPRRKTSPESCRAQPSAVEPLRESPRDHH